MDKTVSTKLNKFEIIFLIVTAVFIMTLVTTSSPIYPFNVWDDTNVYFTLGREILNGRVPYRDLYEQKGPIFLFLYSFAALISKTGFTGVWVLECIAASLFSVFSWKTVKLFINDIPKIAIGLVPLLLSGVYTIGMFNFGGSAEEICFPLLMIVFYVVLKMIRTGKEAMPDKREALICGAIAGVLLWTKYTFLGFMVSVVVLIIIRAVMTKNFRMLGTDILSFLIGVAAASLPVFIYFGVNGSLSYLWESYFYNNIFNYYSDIVYTGWFANPVLRFFALPLLSIKCTFDWFNSYLVVMILSLAGIFVIDRKYRKSVLEFSLVSFIVFLFFLFTRPSFIYYYGYIMMYYSVFALMLCVWLVKLFESKLSNKRLAALLSLIVMVFLTFNLLIKCKNYYLLRMDKEDLSQYILAEMINRTDDPKIITYDIIDGGFYLASGVHPSNRFFTTMNFIENNKEAVEEQESLIEEGYFDYIITMSNDYEWDNYEIVTSSIEPCIDYTKEEFFYEFFLYQRTDANA